MKKLIFISMLFASSIVYSQVGLKGYYLGQKLSKTDYEFFSSCSPIYSCKKVIVGGSEGFLFCYAGADGVIYSIRFVSLPDLSLSRDIPTDRPISWENTSEELIKAQIELSKRQREAKYRMNEKKFKAVEWKKKVELYYDINFIISNNSQANTMGLGNYEKNKDLGYFYAVKDGVEYNCIISNNYLRLRFSNIKLKKYYETQIRNRKREKLKVEF